MLMIENVTALVVFALCLACFALGHALRDWTDGARAEWAEAFAYRQGQARERTAYRRARDGR